MEWLPALGLRAGRGGSLPLPQTATLKESTHAILDLAATALPDIANEKAGIKPAIPARFRGI
jgi:hypothetical protein